MAKSSGHHRGLRAGHALTGATRELGRACCLLVTQGRKIRGTGRPRALALVRVLPALSESRTVAGDTN
jgi:hypothetical protein